MVEPPGGAQGYVLHWTVYEDDASVRKVNILAETTATDSYIAVGWSSDGMMGGSDAVIGWAGHAAAYRLEGNALSDVVPDSGAQAVILDVVVAVAADVVAHVDDERRHAELLGAALGDDGAREAGADDEEVNLRMDRADEHGGWSI